MNKEIKVSICCIAYNHAKYIRKALDGFVNQETNFDYEIIVHDDCSTDGTIEIIKEYQDKYPDIIKPIFESENKYSKKHNILADFCLPVTKGKYIALCEGDDYWIDNTKLQKQYDVLESNPSVLMCCHKTKCTNEDDSFNKMMHPSEKLKMDKSCLIKKDEAIRMYCLDIGFFLHYSSYFVNKKLFEEDSIYYKLPKYGNDDTRMFLAVVSCSDIYFISEVMSNRRLLTKGNWNNRFKELPIDDRVDYSKKAMEKRAIFNKLTNYKYNDLINYSIYNHVLKIYEKYNVKLDLSFLDEYKVRFPLLLSIKFDIKYLLYFISPTVYKKIIQKVR